MVPALRGLTQRDTAPDNLLGLKAKDRVGEVLEAFLLSPESSGTEMFRLKGSFFPVSVWKDGNFTYIIVT